MHGRSRAVLLLPIVTAVAGAPFGGDDSGFVPPNRRAARCEETVASNLARFSRCIVGCDVRAARAPFKGRQFDPQACKQTGPRSCRESYENVSARITRGGRCPACLAPPAHAALADRAAMRLEGDAGVIYCRAVPDASALKCENAGVKSTSFDEEGCEHSCRLAYDRAGTRLGAGCPQCLAGPQQADLASRAETALDEENGHVFCAGNPATTTSTAPPGLTTSTTATSSTTSTTLGCAGEGSPCGPTLDGCG